MKLSRRDFALLAAAGVAAPWAGPASADVPIASADVPIASADVPIPPADVAIRPADIGPAVVGSRTADAPTAPIGRWSPARRTRPS